MQNKLWMNAVEMGIGKKKACKKGLWHFIPFFTIILQIWDTKRLHNEITIDSSFSLNCEREERRCHQVNKCQASESKNSLLVFFAERSVCIIRRAESNFLVWQNATRQPEMINFVAINHRLILRIELNYSNGWKYETEI